MINLANGMQDKRHDRLRQLIGQVGPDKPSSDFTASVMKEVISGEQPDAIMNRNLTVLLKKQPRQGLPSNFTHQVMNQISTYRKVPVSKPVISRRAWLGVAAVIVVFFLFFFYSNQDNIPPQEVTSYLVDSGKAINDTLQLLIALPPLYLIVISCMSALLVVDYIMRAKVRKDNHHHHTIR